MGTTLPPQLVEYLDARLKENTDYLVKKMEDFKQCIIDEFYTRLNVVVNELEDVISTQDAALTALKKHVLKHENLSVASDLRIDGTPFEANENLYDIFNNICHAIGITPPIVKSIFRIKPRNQNTRTQTDKTIIVKLYTPTDKNNLLYNASKFRRNNNCTLSLRHAGFQSDEPIYVNENLTKANHNILKAALQLKQKNQLHAAYTHRGLVYVKKSQRAKSQCIKSIDSLKTFDLSANKRASTNLFRN